MVVVWFSCCSVWMADETTKGSGHDQAVVELMTCGTSGVRTGKGVVIFFCFVLFLYIHML
jgi:hypothetical protein